jgi:hypothetical protein
MTPEFALGLYLASAPDYVLQEILADRPFTLAQLRRLNEFLPHPPRLGDPDAFINSRTKFDPNPNEVQLATIVAPPSTVRRHRRVTRVRLRYMQQDLIDGNFPGTEWPAEMEGEEECK